MGEGDRFIAKEGRRKRRDGNAEFEVAVRSAVILVSDKAGLRSQMATLLLISMFACWELQLHQVQPALLPACPHGTMGNSHGGANGVNIITSKIG